MKKKNRLMITGLLFWLVSCAAETAPPSTAVMPNGALGTNSDIDVRSLDVASYAFGRPLRNEPARAADAVAALDYMGGELNTSPRWATMMPSLFRLQMLQSREIIRQYIGISAQAPSQAVVDTMLALAGAYRSGDQASVQRLLSSPIFTVPPGQVEARLTNVPVIPTVNNATSHADAYSTGFGVPAGD